MRRPAGSASRIEARGRASEAVDVAGRDAERAELLRREGPELPRGGSVSTRLAPVSEHRGHDHLGTGCSSDLNFVVRRARLSAGKQDVAGFRQREAPILARLAVPRAVGHHTPRRRPHRVRKRAYDLRRSGFWSLIQRGSAESARAVVAKDDHVVPYGAIAVNAIGGACGGCCETRRPQGSPRLRGRG